MMEVQVEDAFRVTAHGTPTASCRDEERPQLAVPPVHSGGDAALAPVSLIRATAIDAEFGQPMVAAFLKPADRVRFPRAPVTLDQRSEIIVGIRVLHEHMFAYRSDVLEWAPWDSNPDNTP
jgi:hypothetical protein